MHRNLLGAPMIGSFRAWKPPILMPEMQEMPIVAGFEYIDDWAGSLWHMRAGVVTSRSSRPMRGKPGLIWTNERGEDSLPGGRSDCQHSCGVSCGGCWPLRTPGPPRPHQPGISASAQSQSAPREPEIFLIILILYWNIFRNFYILLKYFYNWSIHIIINTTYKDKNSYLHAENLLTGDLKP